MIAGRVNPDLLVPGVGLVNPVSGEPFAVKMLGVVMEHLPEHDRQIGMCT